MGRFERKNVLVTAAGDGIGRQIFMEFAKKGATIVVSDRNPEAGQTSA